MDNLVLIRVAASLGQELSGAVLRELRQEPPHRWRLVFVKADQSRSIVVSLRAEAPWIGRPHGRSLGPSRPLGGFGTALRGHVLAGVLKSPAERVLTLRFADGRALVVELLPHAANLVVVDAVGQIVESARHPRGTTGRLTPGQAYHAPPSPMGRLDPFHEAPARIDAELAAQLAAGGSPTAAMTRSLLGIGPGAAALVLEESLSTGRRPGEVLVERLAQLTRGDVDPVIESTCDPGEAVEGLDGASGRLLPWEPCGPAVPPWRRVALPRPEETAGLYHDLLERAAHTRRRAESLLTLIEAEVRRTRQATLRASADGAAFAEPDRFRVWGEALLAGLASARRAGGGVLVADPYDVEERLISIPVPPGKDLRQAADEFFQSHRRARRGLEHASRRVALLGARQEQLERLLPRCRPEMSTAEMLELEREMRELGIPIGLVAASRSTRRAAMTERPRIEGVRMLQSSDGLTILVGKTGRENHRLTFKLARPEDFWFHALGVAGAHVLVRNDERRPGPPPRTLEEAAAAAAWYSAAGREGAIEVQWTRRKYVRKVRGGPPGAVTLKRFQTLRVRPRLPLVR